MHCSWPAANSTVADPTGKSFFFSLVNASGMAARFSLRDKDRAIRLAGGGISFGTWKYEGGKETGYPNFMLMHEGAADQQDANCANPINANKAYQLDDGQVCDNTFLAGQWHFAAAEIEVFKL